MDFQFTSEFHHLGQPHDHNTALIILNQPLPNTEYLKSIWTGCNSIRLCADGGANRLFDAFITSNEHGTYLPDFIVGDLDSLRSDVKDFYTSKAVEIVHVADQDSTDFQKCIAHLDAHESTHQHSKSRLLVLGALSGRLDQTLATISTLYSIDACRHTMLVSNDSTATLLPATTPTKGDTIPNRIRCLKGFEGPHCGIASLTCDARVTTTGLKWNLDQSMTVAMDKLISSCNLLDFGLDEWCEVTVCNSHPVLWTVAVDLH